MTKRRGEGGNLFVHMGGREGGIEWEKRSPPSLKIVEFIARVPVPVSVVPSQPQSYCKENSQSSNRRGTGGDIHMMELAFCKAHSYFSSI